jgi:hypothetical protein
MIIGWQWNSPREKMSDSASLVPVFYTAKIVKSGRKRKIKTNALEHPLRTMEHVSP